MEIADVIIIGGGIAGLSAAHGLVREGAGRVRLLEREDALCTHSSGRNAAIFRQLATTPGDFELGRRSREMMTELLGSEAGWLRRTGNWFVAERPQALERFVALAAREGVPCERAEGAALLAAIPQIEGGAARFGVIFPGARGGGGARPAGERAVLARRPRWPRNDRRPRRRRAARLHLGAAIAG